MPTFIWSTFIFDERKKLNDVTQGRKVKYNTNIQIRFGSKTDL